MSFEQFNLHEEVLNGLRDMGFEKPTPIQESCIPMILQGRDVLASAQTGTGKTAAFAIPILDKLFEKKQQNQGGIRALVLTPTRELAGQVDEAFFVIGYHTGITTAKVYGGDDWSRQEKALARGTNIIVATPGRLLDHIKIHNVDFSAIEYLILDEADRMLDMGFIPDITQIVSKLPKKRQTLLFSATLPPKIVQLAQNMMNKPERIDMAPDNTAAEGVSQGMYYVEESDKLPLVLHLYEKEKWNSAIIFMSTKRAVDKLTRELSRKGANVTSIHGDRTQAEREKALESFRKGEFRIIVATDVMSRGIDVEGISHVINFSVPHDVEDYVHRIGRTARAAATGDALTLVSGQDRRYMENIIRAMESKIKKLEIPESILKKGTQNGESSGRKPHRKPPEDQTDGEKSSTQGPQQRRGRKRPGGNRRPGNAAGKDTGGGPQKRDQSKDSRKHEKKQEDIKGSDPAKGSGETQSRKKPQQRKPAKKEKGQSDGRKPGGSASGNRKRQTSRSSRSGTSRKQAPRGNQQKTTKKDVERKELFDNITSPDMERVNKSVSKKGGIWTKVKKLFGTD